MCMRAMRVSRRRFLLAIAASALGFTAVGAVNGVSLTMTRLDFGLGRRVLFLPDIHVHRSGERDYVVRVAEKLGPDIVIIGGDLWDERTHNMSVVRMLVEGLRRNARVVIAILGNHEYWSTSKFPLREAIAGLENLGVMVLRDEVVDGAGLRVAGLDWRDNPRDYEEALQGLGGADVFVSHSPDAFPYLGRRGALLLAGHTHGGQVCLPGSISIATNSVYGYRWGLYRLRGNVMYVSRGLGEMYPPRLYCSREAVLVT